MSVFAISDLHLSLASDKSMDVFDGWENYVDRIETNWKKIVSENDTVIMPGDISWAMRLEETFADFSFIDSLPGKKYLIKGNHDYWWTTVSKMNKYLESSGFNTIGFIHNSYIEVEGIACCGSRGWLCDEAKYTPEDEKILLREASRIETSLKLAVSNGLEPVVFLHYPPVFAQIRCEPIIDVLKEYGVRRCYYGHIHGKAASLAVSGEYEGIRFRLVSCDYNGFSPILVP